MIASSDTRNVEMMYESGHVPSLVAVPFTELVHTSIVRLCSYILTLLVVTNCPYKLWVSPDPFKFA